jgi:transposase
LIGRVADIHAFKRGRAFAGWLGITPREYSSGSTRRLGAISKKGDRYLRTLLIHGARSALLAAARAQANDLPLTRLQRWALNTRQRVGHNKATVALANKMARIAWAVWTRQKDFNGNHAARFVA